LTEWYCPGLVVEIAIVSVMVQATHQPLDRLDHAGSLPSLKIASRLREFDLCAGD
jgi:hypothetical protein